MGAKATYRGLAKGAALAAACLLALGACNGKRENRVRFDGNYYPTKAKAVDRKESVAMFTVEIKNVSQSLDGARAAGEYAGIRYCVTKYGSSYVDWAVGPETDPAQLQIAGDTMTFSGTCLKP